MDIFLSEGSRLGQNKNSEYLKSLQTLEDAKQKQVILEARAMLCDSNHNLIVDLGFCTGIIYRKEGAFGIDTGETRDIAIISKVNKPVCFVVIDFNTLENGDIQPVLSRKMAQIICKENYLNNLVAGDVISGKITHLETFGAFVDVGCGIASLIPIDQISVSRISHPKDRFNVGDIVYAVVKSNLPTNCGDMRISLSHKELLGDFIQNTAMFNVGETVAGIVRSVEDYGVFVELSPNLAGLAEPFPNAKVGMFASVYIKSIIAEKMKIKLVIVDAFSANYPPTPINYYITSGHIDSWHYSPPNALRQIETIFTEE